MSLLNVNTHTLIKIIDAYGSSYIWSALLLNKNMLLTADLKTKIRQWKITNDDLEFYCEKKNGHGHFITILSKIGNGFLLSGGADNHVQIW